MIITTLYLGSHDTIHSKRAMCHDAELQNRAHSISVAAPRIGTPGSESQSTPIFTPLLSCARVLDVALRAMLAKPCRSPDVSIRPSAGCIPKERRLAIIRMK